MSEDPAPTPGPADRAVELLARAMDAVGSERHAPALEVEPEATRSRGEVPPSRRPARSATTPHKMCRSCRALVPKSSTICPECGAGLATVRAPGIGRFVSNVIPGATTRPRRS